MDWTLRARVDGKGTWQTMQRAVLRPVDATVVSYDEGVFVRVGQDEAYVPWSNIISLDVLLSRKKGQVHVRFEGTAGKTIVIAYCGRHERNALGDFASAISETKQEPALVEIIYA